MISLTFVVYVWLNIVQNFHLRSHEEHKGLKKISWWTLNSWGKTWVRVWWKKKISKQMDESICAVRSLTFFGPCLIINCSKFQPYVSAETQRTEKKLILVNPWFLWKYSESYFEGKLDETMHGQKRIWSVAKMYLRFVSRGIAKCI